MPWLLGRDWEAGSELFPRPVWWALLAAPLSLFAAWLVPHSSQDVAKAVMIALYAVSGLCALFAVPTAVFLLAFKPQYRNVANFLLTLIAAIPLAVTLLVLLVYILGATGGRIH